MNNDFKKILEEQKNMTSRERVNYQIEQRNNLIEKQLLRFINNNALDLFIAGGAGSRIPDQDDLAFTNAGVVLNAIYNVYQKYPELGVNNLLEQALIKLLNSGQGHFYTALNTIDTQLHNEKNGSAPFKIVQQQVFISLKNGIKSNMNYLKESEDYRGKLYDNKLYGYVEDIDKKLEEQKGIKVL